MNTISCTSPDEVHKRIRVCSEYAGIRADYALFGWSNAWSRTGQHRNISEPAPAPSTRHSTEQSSAVSSTEQDRKVRPGGVGGSAGTWGIESCQGLRRNRNGIYINLSTPMVEPWGLILRKTLSQQPPGSVFLFVQRDEMVLLDSHHDCVACTVVAPAGGKKFPSFSFLCLAARKLATWRCGVFARNLLQRVFHVSYSS